eukprot:tig00000113_g5635.t1
MPRYESVLGNNGIGLAITAALKGYPLTLVIPGYYSVERRRIMAAYGARVEVTPADQGVMAALYRAIEITKQRPQAWMPNQFENPDNVRAHRLGTAEEILRDFPNGVDYIITGAGSGGHITGVAEVLKAKWPKLKIFCTAASKSRAYEADPKHKVPVQFADSKIAPGEHVGHFIQGMSAGAFIPKNLDLFNYDLGDRYLSMEGLFTDENVHHVEVTSPVVAPPKHVGELRTDANSRPSWWLSGSAGADAGKAAAATAAKPAAGAAPAAAAAAKPVPGSLTAHAAKPAAAAPLTKPVAATSPTKGPALAAHAAPRAAPAAVHKAPVPHSSSLTRK